MINLLSVFQGYYNSTLNSLQSYKVYDVALQ